MPNQEIWIFRTKNFKVVCETVEPPFIDPLVHDQIVIDAVERGEAMLTHFTAIVYHKGVKVGEARLSDCVHCSQPFPEDSLGEFQFHSRIVSDNSYRRKVAQWAIQDARNSLGELTDDLPDVYLR